MKNLLKNLIKAEPTPDNGEIRAAKVLSDFFDAYDIDTAVEIWDENRANFFAHIKSTGQKQALMFVTHLDVVPPGSVEWKHSPFVAVEEDGKQWQNGEVTTSGSGNTRFASNAGMTLPVADTETASPGMKPSQLRCW